MRDVVVFTCEHGGNRVPAPYRELFRGHDDVLNSHRGYDLGALAVARDLAATFKAPLFATGVTRLLVEVNRSLHHSELFSEFTKDLLPAVRSQILEAYYHPHRNRVKCAVGALVAQGERVVHIGVHSFTPELHGEVRNADVGLLYDPRRPLETEFCRRWQASLNEITAGLRVRRNYPYRGAADGLTTQLRRQFPHRQYLGLELEVNQALLRTRGSARAVTKSISGSLGHVFNSSSASSGR